MSLYVVLMILAQSAYEGNNANASNTLTVI